MERRKLEVCEIKYKLEMVGYELLEICPYLDVYREEHKGRVYYTKDCPYRENMEPEPNMLGIVKYPYRLGCPFLFFNGGYCWKIKEKRRQ